MLTTNAFAELGALVGDPARANMLVALMNGRALTATELAAIAGVTPQTASSHLARLVAGDLLAVVRQGRHRYHRLATPAVAQMIEGMMAVAAIGPADRAAAFRTGPRDPALRQARTCYDHLAGRLAVAIADRMAARGEIRFGIDGGELTARGVAFLGGLGIEVGLRNAHGGQAFCRPCLDWSERRPHIAGAVGRSLLDHLMASAWLRPIAGSRAMHVTTLGRQRLGALFDLDSAVWEAPAGLP